MTRKILINGRRAEEVRVAIVENQTLEDFEIETKHSGLLRNNIYRAVVTNIAPSLNAAFVDFGETKNGFLAFNDVVESAYCKPVKDACKMADVLTVGQELIVQVIKDATGLKGAQVTTNISLAGRYLVLRPKDAKSGVSRKVDDDARADLTQKIRSLDLPEGYGCIVRTNAMDQSRAILLRDAKVLVQLWHKIEAEAARAKGPQLLYNDQDIVVQAMRDYFDSSINEVIIDDKSCFERALTYVRATVANAEEKLHLYEDKMPLYTRYGIEKQIECIYARTVRLPSGGFIVIDPTEALTAIDVNSAHSTKRESQDQTAYSTNLEAAVEIGRQLRMRDIGGLIVIDFIDMRQGKHQRDVERVMRNAMARDKARSKVERISANGLLEINRQRISQALSQRTHLECPTCGGRGFIPSADAIGMNLIREIDARAAHGDLGGAIIKLHPDIAQKLQNERRREFAQLELEYNIRIEIVACKDITRGDDAIEWLTKREENELHPERNNASTQDAASIIDVAEAYQASENGEDDDAYRPNDFEEFSSDEARRKRAAKRAARKTAEDHRDETPLDATKSNAKDVKIEAKTDKAVKAEKTSNTADMPKAEQKFLTGCRNASAMAMLSYLLEQMNGRMDEPKKRDNENSHPKLHFRGRRSASKQISTSLQSDIRLFALDILKAVCVIGCGCSTDVTKKEMFSRMTEASDWLMGAVRMSGEELNKCAIALRNQVSSRHATARLNWLFDGSFKARPDELTRLMLDERKAVLGQDENLDDSKLNALQAHIAARLARIFGVSFDLEGIDTSAIEEALNSMTDAELMKTFDAEQEIPVYTTSLLPPDIASKDAAKQQETILDEASDASTNREARRHQRTRGSRRAIGQANDAASPFAGENAEITVADTKIAPMILVQDKTDDTTLSEQEKIALGQAITQEMPAVSGMRRVRHTRRNRAQDMDSVVNDAPAQSSDAVIEAQPKPKAEETPADSNVAQDNTRRVRRTRRNRAEEPAPVVEEHSEDVTAPAAEPVSSDTSLNTRRVRRTRRIRSDEAAPAADDAPTTTPSSDDVIFALPEPVKEAPAHIEETDNARRVRKTRRERVGSSIAETAPDLIAASDAKAYPQISDAPVVENIPMAVPAEPRKEERRVRKTRRIDRNSNMENGEVLNAFENVSTPAKEDVAPAPRFERTRSTRRTRPGHTDIEENVAPAETPVIETAPVIDTAPAAETKVDVIELLNASTPESSKSTRRVRKTRPVKHNDDMTIPAQPAKTAEPVAETAEPVMAAPVAEQISVEPERRRVRKTRRISDAEAPVTPATDADVQIDLKPVADVHQAVSSELEPSENDAASDAQMHSRTRRTRRSRPEDNN